MAELASVTVTHLAGAFADLLVDLGIRDEPHEATAELRALVSEPWSAYGRTALGSSLTESGAPFELSLNLEGSRDPVLRYVVDPADHQRSLTANRERYLRDARAATAAPEAELTELFDSHLRGSSPEEAARVMVGAGFARGGRRRASVYFPTAWLPLDELARRWPVQASAASQAHALLGRPADRVQVFGYDFADGEAVRRKTYSWLPVGPRFPAAAAALAGFRPAQLVYDAFASQVPPRQSDRALFLQLATGGAATHAKLFFFSRAWDWSSAEGLAEVLGFLDTRFDVDLQPLLQVRAAAERHQLPLTIGLIAVGGDTRSPSVTFYFWPA